VIDGVFVSYEEFWKDQQKYKDIVKLYQAKERLRAYNSLLSGKIRDWLAEHDDWSIVINSQDVADLTYREMPGSKQLWTADIDLKKSDGGFGSINGTYSGVFKLSMDADMSTFDNGYADFEAKLWSSEFTHFYAIGNEGQSSEIKLAYEIPNCRLNIALPSGVSRHFFEENIPSSNLTQTDFTVNVDRTATIRSTIQSGGYEEIVVQIIEDNGVYSYNDTQTLYIPGKSPFVTSNPDGAHNPWPPDTRGYVTMTLIIDMLDK
jgi:hypothetical protein